MANEISSDSLLLLLCCHDFLVWFVQVIHFPCLQWIGCPKKTRAIISVKRMGELDIKPFLEAAKRKFSVEVNEKAATRREKVQMKAIEWCSKWDECLKDPSWHPFKVVTDKEGNAKVQ